MEKIHIKVGAERYGEVSGVGDKACVWIGGRGCSKSFAEVRSVVKTLAP